MLFTGVLTELLIGFEDKPFIKLGGAMNGLKKGFKDVGGGCQNGFIGDMGDWGC